MNFAKEVYYGILIGLTALAGALLVTAMVLFALAWALNP